MNGDQGLLTYKNRIRQFMASMQKLEYLAEGFGASKYQPVDMILSNLLKEKYLPIRFIVSDQNMPGMQGTEMCGYITEYFDLLK